MSVTTSMLSTGSGLLDRLLCVLGAVSFSQGPEFIQQYLQRLGGHVDEARRQVVQYEDVARQSGLTLDQFIAQTNANADGAVAKLGGVMTEATTRLHHLESSQAAIAQSSVWERPFVFLRNMDSEIANSTWAIFKPAVPTTVEGLLYALVGMIVLLGLYHAVFRLPVQAGYRAYRRRRGAERVVA